VLLTACVTQGESFMVQIQDVTGCSIYRNNSGLGYICPDADTATYIAAWPHSLHIYLKIHLLSQRPLDEYNANLFMLYKSLNWN
jgi:hypothetical protein